MITLQLHGGPRDGQEFQMAAPLPLVLVFLDPDTNLCHAYSSNGPPTELDIDGVTEHYDHDGHCQLQDLPIWRE